VYINTPPAVVFIADIEQLSFILIGRAGDPTPAFL
jgi:hypothetical protein